MPRFYFDVREGDNFTRDNEGLRFDSLDTAEYEAARGAAEMGRDCLPKSDVREVAVQVRDEHGDPILTVAVSMTVRRTELAQA